MKKSFLLIILTLFACSNELKFEQSRAVFKPLQGEQNYAFYLVSNYDTCKYINLERFVSDEFNRVIQSYDSLKYLQFNFYKKNWNTSIFLDTWDPYGHHSLMLPENEEKYGKYCIGGFFYDRIDNSNKWVFHTFKNNFTDTIEVK